MDQAQTRLPRRHYLSVAAIGVALAGAGVWYGAQGRRPRLKNVILISIDTLRADHLGYMGYDRPTSPAIDRFAAQSLDFHNAFTQAPETLPSHASLFTSVYPSVHKAHVGNRLPLGEGFVTLAEHFRDGGFRTAAFVGGWQVAERWKLDQGFEVYEDPNSEAGRYSNTPGVLEEILERASHWIEDHSSQRFFCFIHTYVVHEPYAPPPGYDRMFDEGYTGPLPWRIGLHDCLELNKTVRHPDEPDVRHIVSLYDAEIRYMDDHLGEFLDKLTHLGLHRNTVIVFVADHGEEFAEHGRVGRHGHTLFDELLHVPLLMRIPGVQPRVIERQVRLIDVAPTLLALMKIGPGDAALQGRDLLADDGLRGPDLPVLSQWPSPIGLWASLRYPDRKILGLDGRMFAFYQLDKDPAERNDCFNWDDDVHKQMVKEIQALMAENNDLVRHSAPPIELEPEAEEELRSLGYLE